MRRLATSRYFFFPSISKDLYVIIGKLEVAKCLSLAGWVTGQNEQLYCPNCIFKRFVNNRHVNFFYFLEQQFIAKVNERREVQEAHPLTTVGYQNPIKTTHPNLTVLDLTLHNTHPESACHFDQKVI